MSIEACKQILIEAIDKLLIPGATFGIYQNGEESYFNYGYKQLVPVKVENNIDTLYDMASCSKVVCTTTMILKLMEEGKFNLETKVNELLTDFPYDNITIKHLLTHTSGLPADDKAYRNCKDAKTMYEFIKTLKLNNKPGEIVEYSDFGFILLGFIIDKITGSLEEYAKKTIFIPLDMKDSMYNPYLKNRKEDCACSEVTDTRGIIQGIVHDGKANILKGLSGNAGLFSNVKDLMKFAKMLINDGDNVLSKDSVDYLKHSYTQGLNLNRTLGWQVASEDCSCGKYYSDTAIYHTGFSGTSIFIDFKKKVIIILLTNRVHPSRDNANIIPIRNAFHDEVLKDIC